MSNNNQLAKRPKFSVAITTKTYQDLISNTLGDPERAKRFIATISSAVAVNPALQECEAGTILAGALLGESLNLSPSPQLGQFYLVPFDCKMKDASGKTVWATDENGNKLKDHAGHWIPVSVKKAQFVLGYKGYIQLAIRSGQYKKMNVLEIKEGELRYFDPLNETIDCILIDDFEKREAAPTVGYYVMFEYTNGFRKAMYWSKEKMLSHADTYSPAFSKKAYEKIQRGEIADKDIWQYSSFWYKDFDGMAKKTMLRQIISHWGVMSTEMQTAFDRDASISEIGVDQQQIITPEADLKPPALETEELPIVEKVNLDEID